MKNKGFTLVEMSIIIVIIGLLVAGIITGQSIVQSARLKEVISDYDRYVKAIKEFSDKYQALPGDMSNAESIWGSDTTCPNTVTNTTPKVVTCNGNGDGRIGACSTAGVIDNTYSYEWFRAWQQLANAGLIEGKFTGVKESATNGNAGIGINVPQSKLLERSGWMLYYYLLITTNSNLWGDNYGHVLSLGSDTSNVTNGVALKPAEALSIDQKIDDGLPGRGIVRARRTASEANCTANNTSQDNATYNASYTSRAACSLLFILGF